MLQVVGHRGASKDYPENTLISFEAAIREGATGIESDVHLSKDGRILCTHDASLDRGTTGTRLIRDQNWAGDDGMQHVRTTKAPFQPIPLFSELLDLLMRPGNEAVTFWIDIKVTSQPEAIFPVLAELIEKHPSIKPRVILGLWHPSFILPSYVHFPREIKRFHIGACTKLARSWFFDYVDGFSLLFDALVSANGAVFRAECLAAGKEVGVWTVNDPREMAMALEWGINAILTDVPLVALDLERRTSTREARDAYYREIGLRTWLFPWSRKYWNGTVAARVQVEVDEIVRDGGPIEAVAPLPPLEELTAMLITLPPSTSSPTMDAASLIPEVMVPMVGENELAARVSSVPA